VHGIDRWVIWLRTQGGKLRIIAVIIRIIFFEESIPELLKRLNIHNELEIGWIIYLISRINSNMYHKIGFITLDVYPPMLHHLLPHLTDSQFFVSPTECTCEELPLLQFLKLPLEIFKPICLIIED
jgi:hypothetical protein